MTLENPNTPEKTPPAPQQADQPQQTPEQTPEQTPPNPFAPDQVDLEVFKQAANRSIGDIASEAANFTPEAQPLGDITPQGNQGPQLPPSSDLGVNLDGLLNEVDQSQVPEGATESAKESFESLKSNYKTKISEFKSQFSELQSQLQEAQQQIQNLSPIEQEAAQLRAKVEELNTMLAGQDELRERVDRLSFYEKKYDLYNSPEIKNDYLEPMSAYKTKAMEIIEGSMRHRHADDATLKTESAKFWDKLRLSNNDYETNSMISDAGITDLNAMALKSSVNQFKSFDKKLTEISDPQYIDSTIAQMRGQTQIKSEEKATLAFNGIQRQFSEHIQEIQEDKVNREHNYFVYEKTVEDAKQKFETLRGVMSSEYGNHEQALSLAARMAFKDAAYDSQSLMLKFLIKENERKDQRIAQLKSPSSPQQTSETPTVAQSPESTIESIKSQTQKSIKDIANSAVFSS